jgi:hypothetical protein
MKRRHLVAALIALALVGVVVLVVFWPRGPQPHPALANKPPTAEFTHEASGTRPHTLQFDATKSNDPDGKLTTYEWDFGDGQTAEGAQVEHTYPDADGYLVRLTATDDRGATDDVERTIISPPVPDPRNWADVLALVADGHLLLADIEPGDGGVVRGTEAWVRWMAHDMGGRVYWHKQGEAGVDITPATGEDPLTARLGGLRRARRTNT